MHIHFYHFLRGWVGWRLNPVPEVEDLPLALYPLPAKAERGDTLAIFVSGDGGWGRMGSSVARALSRAGIPVVGIDSTRYFWKERSAEESAQDFSRVLQHFSKEWGCRQVVFLGYSFGADVLPMVLNSLSDSQLAGMTPRRLILLSVGDRVELAFKFVGWMGHELREHEGEAIAPYLRALVRDRHLPVTAFRGHLEKRGLQTEAELEDVRILPGGHFYHFAYRNLAQEVLKAALEDVGERLPDGS